MIRVYSQTDKDGIRFVSKAVSKDNGRPALNYLYYDKAWGLFLGTDGYRLHGYQPEQEFETGFYSILKNKKTEVVLGRESEADAYHKFPDWQLIFPHTTDELETLSEHGRNTGSTRATEYTKVVRSLTEKETLNYDFFSDVMDYGPFDYWSTGYADPLCFTNHDKFALVMPVRM